MIVISCIWAVFFGRVITASSFELLAVLGVDKRLPSDLHSSALRLHSVYTPFTSPSFSHRGKVVSRGPKDFTFSWTFRGWEYVGSWPRIGSTNDDDDGHLPLITICVFFDHTFVGCLRYVGLRVGL